MIGIILRIAPDGTTRFIYADELRGLMDNGPSKIERASHVEPGLDGKWYADLEPVKGPVLGPFDLRADALAAEVNWLNTHYI